MKPIVSRGFSFWCCAGIAVDLSYPEEVKVVQGTRTGLGTSQSYEDDANQRSDCQKIRRDDTRNATTFTHDGGLFRAI